MKWMIQMSRPACDTPSECFDPRCHATRPLRLSRLPLLLMRRLQLRVLELEVVESLGKIVVRLALRLTCSLAPGLAAARRRHV
jgi:hypothetical protein